MWAAQPTSLNHNCLQYEYSTFIFWILPNLAKYTYVWFATWVAAQNWGEKKIIDIMAKTCYEHQWGWINNVNMICES
jgi:hypothetical protein